MLETFFKIMENTTYFSFSDFLFILFFLLIRLSATAIHELGHFYFALRNNVLVDSVSFCSIKNRALKKLFKNIQFTIKNINYSFNIFGANSCVTFKEELNNEQHYKTLSGAVVFEFVAFFICFLFLLCLYISFSVHLSIFNADLFYVFMYTIFKSLVSLDITLANTIMLLAFFLFSGILGNFLLGFLYAYIADLRNLKYENFLLELDGYRYYVSKYEKNKMPIVNPVAFQKKLKI